MRSLHDWTLHSVRMDWKSGTLTVDLCWETENHELVALGVRKLLLPREFPWGPSRWINEIAGPLEIAGGLLEMKIEMQSGDTIQILAETFELPPSKSTPAAGQLPLGK